MSDICNFYQEKLQPEQPNINPKISSMRNRICKWLPLAVLALIFASKIYGTTWNDESAIIDFDLIEEEVNRDFPD